METTVPTSTFTVEDHWLNESLYELHRPKGVATVQVLLFHGFQPDYEKPHLTTWTSRDGSHLWPQTWLAEEFPDAHILSVSYFGGKLQDVLKKFGNRLDVDMHIVIENLISDLLQAGIGQKPRCPVVLIGHSFGGLVVKQLCVRAFNQLGPDSRTAKDMKTVQLVNFVDNIKGVFFFATPHHGVQSKSITLLDPALLIPKGPLLDYVKCLSNHTARLNDEFDSRWKQHTEWRMRGLGESLPTRFDTKWRSFEDLIVPEGSARYSVFNLAEGVDHFSISRPDSKICRSFTGVKGLLEDIANDPQLVVLDGHQETGLPDYLMASEKHVLAIKQKLTEARVLSITGMGGIGKTTLAKKVYNNMSKDFEYTCFAENVKVQHNAVNYLDDWLLSKFYRNGRRAELQQWSELKGKKTLIIMDDIDSEDQLRRLPGLQEFANGSHIIFTSRNEEISKFFRNCGLYKMDFLEEDEAKELFCQHAFGVKDVPVESNQLSKNVEAVVRKCDRLPLTLELMGRYLRGESDYVVWKDAVDQLTRAESVGGGTNDGVWARLRVSFDALEEQQKIMFTEAGTYFFGQSLHQALGAWSMTFKNPKIMWRNLVGRSLVKEGQDKTVWVHEQLRDLSRSIAKNDIVLRSDENADIVEQERVSDNVSTIVNEFCEKLGQNTKRGNEIMSYSFQVSAKIEALKVSYRRRALQLDSLVDCKELKYVDFDTVEHEGSGSNFPRRVSLLKWKTRPESKSQFPIDLKRMKNLAVLELENWYVPKPFPETLGHLTNLRYLSLSYLKGLNHLPANFDGLSHLKWLKVKGPLGEGEGLTRVSPELFGKLLALEHLKLENVEVAELPESFGDLSALEHLELVNVQLEKLPESFGNLSSLKSLHIQDCPLERLPDSFSRLSRLQRLSLSCLRLTELGDSFGRLSALKDLSLYRLPITRLPDSFSQLSRLQKLSIMWCWSLKDLGDTFGSFPALVSFVIQDTDVDRLPESVGGLISLRELEISSNRLKRLPESLGELNQLETLDVTGKSLKSLPFDFRKLSSLRTLTIRCPVEELPDGLQMLSALKKLEMKVEMKSLPYSLGKLSSLERLFIGGDNLESLPDSIGQLRSLRTLTLSVAKLESLPYSLGKLSSLESLDISGDNLESLPDSIGQLRSLRTLTLSVAKLESLPYSLGKLSSLESLEISGYNLESLPDSIGQLRSLRTLRLDGAELEGLPESIGQLSSLRELTLYNVASIRRLPVSVQQLPFLREFSFECAGHQRLPDNFDHLQFSSLALTLFNPDTRLLEDLGRLSSLEDLQLEYLVNENLPEELGNLKSLRTLKIWWCDKLESLPDSLGRLSSLRELRLLGCSNLKSLPDSLGQLSSLRELYLYECNNLKSLPDSLGRLSSLRELYLYECNNLKSLPDSLGQLSSLRELYLAKCNNLKSLPRSLGRHSSSELAPRQGERRNTEELSLQTTFGEANKGELNIFVGSGDEGCCYLDESTMRSLGWVMDGVLDKGLNHTKLMNGKNLELFRNMVSNQCLSTM